MLYQKHLILITFQIALIAYIVNSVQGRKALLFQFGERQNSQIKALDGKVINSGVYSGILEKTLTLKDLNITDEHVISLIEASIYDVNDPHKANVTLVKNGPGHSEATLKFQNISDQELVYEVDIYVKEKHRN